jgi:hypothetical protein
MVRRQLEMSSRLVWVIEQSPVSRNLNTYFFFFFKPLGFELRALSLLGRYSTA